MISTPITGATTPTIMLSTPTKKPIGTKAQSGRSLGRSRPMRRANKVRMMKPPISICSAGSFVSMFRQAPGVTPRRYFRPPSD